MPRNVAPRSHTQCKRRVVAGSHDEFAKAAVRDAGAGVPGNRMNDPALAALDEDVGDGLADRSALRKRVEMTLALGGGAGDKIWLAERCRLTEHRPGDV